MTTEMNIDERPQDEVTIDSFRQSFALIVKSVTTYDQRYIWKVLRDLVELRKQLNLNVLNTLVNMAYTGDERRPLLKTIGGGSIEVEVEKSWYQEDQLLPEIDAFIHLLTQIYLLDSNEVEKLVSFNTGVITLLKKHNRRSLDLIAAKVWFYVSRASELHGDLVSLRPELLAALRTATLKHNEETRGVLITLILRNFLSSNDFEQASNFIEKIEFSNSSSSIEARYLYYMARIAAVQLNYSTANDYVIGAIRKAPQTTKSIGFLQTAYKLNVVIELLMGEVPELSFFTKSGYENCLAPYLAVTKAVRQGDLHVFRETLSKYKDVLVRDGNYNLVTRLRSNVIKTGIKIISLTYKRISLKDICLKLHLDSEQDAEYIVSKAIRDGVIEATINNEKGFMESNELLNVYATTQPQDVFHTRIQFVNQLHDESVKSMRYPDTNRLDKSLLVEAEDDFDLDMELDEDFF